MSINGGTYSSSPASSYLPCGPYISSSDYNNPWQVVWIGSSHPLDVEQQAFNYQANTHTYLLSGSMTIDIIEGADKCIIEEVFRCDSITGECPDPISIDRGNHLSSLSYADMAGEGPFFYWQGIPNRIPTGYVRYVVRFLKEGNVTIKYTDDATGEIINYHTFIAKPDYYLDSYNSMEIPHGEKAIVDINAEPVQCSDQWLFWNGGSLPEEVKFEVEMLTGSEYGKLVNIYYDENDEEIKDSAFSFNGLDDTYELYFASSGIEPEDTGKVRIRYSTTDPAITPIETELNIIKNNNYPVRVTFEPEVLAPGDTANIILERRFDDYPFDYPNDIEYEEFDEEQLFNVSIVKGAEYGTILDSVSADTADVFTDIYKNFKFIAKDSIDVSSAEISIRVSTIIDNGGIIFSKSVKNKGKQHKLNIADREETSVRMKAIKKIKGLNKTRGKIENPAIEFIIIPSEGGEEIFGIGKAEIKDEEIEIMLGETKYFQAQLNSETGKMKIFEIEVKLTGLEQSKGPALDGFEWIETDVWNDNPTTNYLPIPSSPDYSPVYWEKGLYPTYEENFDFIKMEPLDPGLIRIMGRFWKEKDENQSDEDYKNKYTAKLTAKNENGLETSIKLIVIKPTKLGTIHNEEKDVKGNIYNLDDKIIKYAGEYGIPPQFIKADIQAEGNFNPAIRYEPFWTISKLYKLKMDSKELVNRQYVHDLLKSSPYKVTVNDKIYLEDNNTNPIPSIGSMDGLEEHNYITIGPTNGDSPVYIPEYPGYVGSIWDYFYANCKTVNPNASFNIYPKKKPQWYENAITGWDDAFDIGIEDWEEFVHAIGLFFSEEFISYLLSDDIKNTFARSKANEWLSTEYKLGIFKKGIAQTRTASSYGMMQIMYATAKSERSYGNKPEFLNEYEINFTNSLGYLKTKLEELLSEINHKNNIIEGLENFYIKSFNNYHGTSDKNFENVAEDNIDYGTYVIDRNKKFNPIK
jgi:hypothetical protein